MVLVLCLLAVGVYALLDRPRGRAAAVGRIALISFLAFCLPYVAFEGIGLGVLGQELNGLAADQRDMVAAGLVEDFARNPILGEPGVFWALGTIAWIVVVSTVLAFRRANAPAALQILLGSCAMIAAHAPPIAGDRRRSRLDPSPRALRSSTRGAPRAGRRLTSWTPAGSSATASASARC